MLLVERKSEHLVILKMVQGHGRGGLHGLGQQDDLSPWVFHVAECAIR